MLSTDFDRADRGDGDECETDCDLLAIEAGALTAEDGVLGPDGGLTETGVLGTDCALTTEVGVQGPDCAITAKVSPPTADCGWGENVSESKSVSLATSPSAFLAATSRVIIVL